MKAYHKTILNIGRVIILAVIALMLGIGLTDQPVLAQPTPSLLFIENVGQLDPSVRFQTYGPISLSLTEDALWFTLIEPAAPVDPSARAAAPADTSRRGVNLKLSFVNANPHPTLEPFNRLDTQVSFFASSDPARWQTNVPVWGGVRYVDLYPGLNLEITTQNGQLAPRLVWTGQAATSAPTLSDVRLQVEGADTLVVANNQLRLTTSAGEFSLPLLQVDPALAQTATNLTPQIEGNIVSHPFSPAPVAASPAAQIAGVTDLIYSTFLGGSGSNDEGMAIAVDAAGNAYVAGHTISADFPTTPGAFDTTASGGFVVKLNPTGTDLVYATFLSGGQASGVAVDSSGNAYITGSTSSADFPATPGAFDTTVSGSDAFAVKLNPAGSALIYATLLGGGGDELGQKIAIDSSGNAYLTGYTTSPDFPATPGAFDTNFHPGGWFGQDAFVAKINPTGSALSYATFLGGDSDDTGVAIAVDAAGSAYVTGDTESSNFPTTPGAFNTTIPLIFVTKLTPTGNALTYATFLGGGAPEHAHAIAVDQAGNTYIAGETYSASFPTTPGAFQTTYHSTGKVTYEGDGFVFKLNATGSAPVYSTFLGGNDHDIAFGLAIDQTGQAYVTGVTYATDFPTTADAFQPTRSGYPDAFVSKLNAAGSELVYGTFLGGEYGESGYAIAADQANNAYVTGYTSSANFPVTSGAFDTELSGSSDSFVAKLFTHGGAIEPTPTPSPSPTPSPTLSPSPTPSPTSSPSPSPTPSSTPSPIPSPTPSPTSSPISSPTPPPTPVPAQTCAPTLLGTLTVGNTPRGIALDVARQRIYVANYGSNSVSVINSSTNALVATITGIPSANHIAYDGLHNMLWVTNYQTDQVTPIQINDTATTFTALPPVQVGDGPWDVVFEPVYGYLYVANSLGNSVSVVNVASRTVVATLADNFNQPFRMATSPALGGKVYVTNFGNATVTVLKGTAVNSVVNLYDSSQPYGIAIDETRNLIYVATVNKNRIVAIGTLNGVPDQFLGWAAFYRGFNRNRPLPLRAIGINPDIGPSYDGGHIWATTSTADGSELNQALFISKGWSAYFHVPVAQNVSNNPAEGLAIDRVNDRVYIASGVVTGTVTIIGDHANQCPGAMPASVSDDANQFEFDLFSREAIAGGDVTGDGVVDIFDLAFIASRYHTTDVTADVNADGQVDIFDLTIAASHYGQ